jgi:hypothetical protein
MSSALQKNMDKLTNGRKHYMISFIPLKVQLQICPVRSRCVRDSVVDPDPSVFGPPGLGSVSQRYGSGSFYHQTKIVRKILIPTVLMNNVNVHSSNKQKIKNF